AQAPRHAADPAAADLAAARRVFEANLDAIRMRNRDAYLACYLHSETLARTGPTGYTLGYAQVESTRSNTWPDHFEALDLKLTPVRPGVVYGTYRYRVRYGADEQSGLSERVFVATPDGWRIAVSTAFQNLPGVPPPPRAIVGATLIDGRGGSPIRDAVVVIRNGMIDCAGPRARCPVPAGVDTLDARGMWLLPGLVDAHVHYSQTGWADGRPDALDFRGEFPYEQVETRLEAHPQRFHRAYLACGVTAVFDVGGFPWTLRMRDEAEKSTEAPHVSTAGPLLSTLDHWLNLPAERQFIVLRDDSTARAGVHYLKAIGANAVKVWFINRPTMNFPAMERAVTAAGEEAHKAGMRLLVHATGLQEAKAALRAGADLLVHSVDNLPVDEEFIAMARKNGTIYCPTLTVRDGYTRMYRSALEGQPPPIDDPNGVVDSLTLADVMATPEVARRAHASRPLPRSTAVDSTHRQMAENLMRVMHAGIPIAMGTDAGNPLTLHGPAVYAEMETMQKDGMRPMDVIVAATRNGARAMGREKEFGTIEKGKQADLLAVGADPTRDVANLRRIRWVARGGVLRSIEELRAAIRAAGRR
ncbi:MAG: amidohydrolase family protein, partial [Candidatus Eisenbacteria bacterium]|nr:amidohydrolase family protein [Candidatus Eisenbacteria bacterium]